MDDFSQKRKDRLSDRIGELSMLNVTSDSSGVDTGVLVYSVSLTRGIRGILSLKQPDFRLFEHHLECMPLAQKRQDQADAISSLLAYEIFRGTGSFELLEDYPARGQLEEYLILGALFSARTTKTRNHVRMNSKQGLNIVLIDWITEDKNPLLVAIPVTKSTGLSTDECLKLADDIATFVTVNTPNCKPTKLQVTDVPAIKAALLKNFDLPICNAGSDE